MLIGTVLFLQTKRNIYDLMLSTQGEMIVDCFLREYKATIKKEFVEYGFKVYRTNFYRVINDVFQSFNIHRSVSGEEVTVEFLVIPLADSYAIDKSRCGFDHLKVFENDWSWFHYNRNSEESIDDCIKEIICYMKKYLIPFFEDTCSCDKIYCQLQDNKYIDFLQQSKRNVALKVRDFDLANHYLNEEIEQIRFAIAQNKKISNNLEFIKSMEEQYQKVIEEKQEFQRYIISKDVAFLDGWIKTNEKNNLQNLNWKSK